MPSAWSAHLFALVPWLLFALPLLVHLAHPRMPGFDAGQGQIGGELFFADTDAARGGLVWFLLCFAAGGTCSPGRR